MDDLQPARSERHGHDALATRGADNVDGAPVVGRR
jgi:hypothetical protein